MQIDLALSSYKSNLKVRHQGPVTEVLDPVRRKYVVLTPEEYVRQLMILYLTDTCGYSINRIQVEREIIVNSKSLRFDIVILDDELQPYILIECKRHTEQINDRTFDQVSLYNQSLKANYLIITNGIRSYCASIDYDQKTYRLIDHIPNQNH